MIVVGCTPLSWAVTVTYKKYILYALSVNKQFEHNYLLLVCVLCINPHSNLSGLHGY